MQGIYLTHSQACISVVIWMFFTGTISDLLMYYHVIYLSYASMSWRIELNSALELTLKVHPQVWDNFWQLKAV